MRAAPTGLAAALALLAATALAACGDDEGSAATESFCEEYTQLEEELSGTDYEDPAAVGDAFDRIAELDPPDEIAEEFRAVIALNQEIYSASDGADLSDPEAASELQEQFSERAAELEEESQKVDDFLTEECGAGDS